MLALPLWEREGWRMAFDAFGPLDWRRDDWRDARQILFASAGNKTLGELVLFKEPRPNQTESEALKLFGDDEEDEEF